MHTPSDRIDRLESEVNFLKGQVQALAALLALRVGSDQVFQVGEVVGPIPTILGEWELAVAHHQLEGLEAFVATNAHPLVADGLEGILLLLRVSLDEARGRHAA